MSGVTRIRRSGDKIDARTRVCIRFDYQAALAWAKKQGKKRVPNGVIDDLAELYNVSSVSIVQIGRGYARQERLSA